MVLVRVMSLALVAACLVMTTGCQQGETVSMNSPQTEDSPPQPGIAEYFAYHNDQGMISDMSIADVHFIPHQASLSGIGEARLERYAELLATTGGTLNYDTRLQDNTLIEARLAIAREFLAHAVPGKNQISVVLGMPGGRGMLATESMGGLGVARQPEPRGTAYRLNETGGGGGGN